MLFKVSQQTYRWTKKLLDRRSETSTDRRPERRTDRQSADLEWSLLGGHPLNYKSLLKTWICVTWKLRNLISPTEWSHLYRFYGFKLLSVSAKDLLKFASLSVFSSAENPSIQHSAQSSSHQKTKECTHLGIYLRGKRERIKLVWLC